MSYPDDSEPVYLDEDPAEYRDGPPDERRLSSHAVMGGDRVWQDFGAPEVDRQITLRTDWMTTATLDDFKARFAAVGQPWKWVDHKGADYRVLFRGLRHERIQGYDAYVVEMMLDVLQVVPPEP